MLVDSTWDLGMDTAVFELSVHIRYHTSDRFLSCHDSLFDNSTYDIQLTPLTTHRFILHLQVAAAGFIAWSIAALHGAHPLVFHHSSTHPFSAPLLSFPLTRVHSLDQRIRELCPSLEFLSEQSQADALHGWMNEQ